jgi:hypothetical protein
MIQTTNQEIVGAPDTMAAFAIGRAAGGYGGSSPREMETW